MRFTLRKQVLQFGGRNPAVITAVSKNFSDTLVWRPAVVLTASPSGPFTGTTAVKFGTVTSAFTLDSPTQITVAAAPVHAAGAAPITVIGPNGISNAMDFQYWDPNTPGASSSFLEISDYTNPAPGNNGIWLPRSGSYRAINNIAGTVPAENLGAPRFVYASNSNLAHEATAWNALIGLSAAAGATIAVIVDLDSLPGPYSAIVSDHEFLGGIYLEKVAGVATFFYNTGGVYKFASIAIPSTGLLRLVFVRDISNVTPVIRGTANGVTYSADVAVGDLASQSYVGLYLGYNPVASGGVYPLQATIKMFVTAKFAWTAADIAKFYAWAPLVP